MEELIKCYLCNKSLLHEKVIEGKLQKIFHPERVQTEFYLNNGSRMPVSICSPCKENIDLNNPIIQNKIMNNIIDGWQVEQDLLLSQGRTTKEYSDNVMEHHKSLSILFKSENLDDYQIKARVAK